MTTQDMIKLRSASLATYIKSVGEFLKQLPGVSQVCMPDRLSIFVTAFFPVVAAQLSLSFDVERQVPNNMSLDRESGTWQMMIKTPTHMQVEHFLIDSGNALTKTIFNLKEFALFCALLCFNVDSPSVGNVDNIRAIRTRYELALIHYSSSLEGSEERLAQFYQLLSKFRRAISVYYRHLHDLPQRCDPTTTKRPATLF